MTTIRTLLKAMAAILGLVLCGPVAAEPAEKIPVVATFSILGDMVARIGGPHVDVTSLVGPDGDTHVYQPTPADARAVGDAEILVVNGLGFEGWLDRLSAASDFSGIRVVATEGIEAIPYVDGEDHDAHEDHHDGEDHHDHEGHAKHEDHAKHGDHEEHDDHAKHEDTAHIAKDNHGAHERDAHERDAHERDAHKGDAHEGEEPEHEEHAGHGGHHHGAFDPHAWQSLRLAVTYVDNITAALARADPAHATDYYQNRAAYVAQIEALDTEIQQMVESLPASRRTVVTSHDAFQYFGRDYGLTFLAPQGLSTASEASAQDVARLVEQMRAKGISAVFVENITNPRLVQQIAKEAGATIGGTLYPGALSGPDGPAQTYLDMMRHNAATLSQALSS